MKAVVNYEEALVNYGSPPRRDRVSNRAAASKYRYQVSKKTPATPHATGKPLSPARPRPMSLFFPGPSVAPLEVNVVGEPTSTPDSEPVARRSPPHPNAQLPAQRSPSASSIHHHQEAHVDVLLAKLAAKVIDFGAGKDAESDDVTACKSLSPSKSSNEITRPHTAPGLQLSSSAGLLTHSSSGSSTRRPTSSHHFRQRPGSSRKPYRETVTPLARESFMSHFENKVSMSPHHRDNQSVIRSDERARSAVAMYDPWQGRELHSTWLHRTLSTSPSARPCQSSSTGTCEPMSVQAASITLKKPARAVRPQSSPVQLGRTGGAIRVASLKPNPHWAGGAHTGNADKQQFLESAARGAAQRYSPSHDAVDVGRKSAQLPRSRREKKQGSHVYVQGPGSTTKTKYYSLSASEAQQLSHLCQTYSSADHAAPSALCAFPSPEAHAADGVAATE